MLDAVGVDFTKSGEGSGPCRSEGCSVTGREEGSSYPVRLKVDDAQLRRRAAMGAT